MKLYRSTMFVPGNRADWIAKAPKYGSDALMIDLEDAVPIAEKHEAREIVRGGIEGLRDTDIGVFVRLNGIDTGLTSDDIEAVVVAGLDAVAVPKLETPEEVLKVDAWLEHFERKAGLEIGTIELGKVVRRWFTCMSPHAHVHVERAWRLGARGGLVRVARKL